MCNTRLETTPKTPKTSAVGVTEVPKVLTKAAMMTEVPKAAMKAAMTTTEDCPDTSVRTGADSTAPT